MKMPNSPNDGCHARGGEVAEVANDRLPSVPQGCHCVHCISLIVHEGYHLLLSAQRCLSCIACSSCTGAGPPGER